MNTLAKSLSVLCLASLALLLSACGNGASPPIDPPLKGAKIGGEFELTNTSGETVHWADFKGRYRIVYFGFTYCPDICPTDIQRTIQGLNQFKQSKPELGAQITPIFISVDPERDTPEVMDEFTNAFSPDLIGLTGTPEQVADAAATFGVYYAKLDSSSDDNYLIDHTRAVLLFGPAGEPIALLPADLGADAVAEELAEWVT